METPTVATISNATSAASTGASLGQDDFLRMLIAQLENQDPLNPQEATEFSSQLAQFSSLEQEIAMRTSLDRISATLSNGDKGTAIELIGREVIAQTPQFELKGEPTTLRFDLAGATDTTILEIRDSGGTVVHTSNLGANPSGVGEFRWDGLGSTGIPLPNGVYSFEVLGSSDLMPVSATALTQGRITGADVSGGDPALRIGEIVIPLSGVREVRDSSASSGGLF